MSEKAESLTLLQEECGFKESPPKPPHPILIQWSPEVNKQLLYVRRIYFIHFLDIANIVLMPKKIA